MNHWWPCPALYQLSKTVGLSREEQVPQPREALCGPKRYDPTGPCLPTWYWKLLDGWEEEQVPQGIRYSHRCAWQLQMYSFLNVQRELILTLPCDEFLLVWFSESRGDREKESGYFSPDRRGDRDRQTEEANKRIYRYYERGHPLPSNYVLEPKACVPYRNVNLGLPSQRRNPDTYLQEAWRSESPERYTYHSNFRRGTDSERNSPTRHSSVSPDRYKLAESPAGTQRRSSLSRIQPRSHASSQLPSHVPSRHTSGRSSPSRRRGSIAARTASPPRASPAHRRTDSSHLQNGQYDAQMGCSPQLRSSSQASNKHSLDSEKLYRNLESISRRGSSAIQRNSYEGSQATPRTRTAVNSSANTRSRNSREVSPPRNGYSTHSHSPQREAYSRESRLSPSQGSWQGSAHSLLSLPPSRGSSSSRRGVDSQVLGGLLSHVAVTETDKGSERNNAVSGERSQSSIRRGMDALLISEPKKAAVEVEQVHISDITYCQPS